MRAQDGGDTPSGTSLESIEEKAQERREQARELKEKAATLSEQARSLKAKSVTTARRIQELERELTDIEDTLATLEAERRRKRRQLDDRQGQLAQTLAALQRIAVLPPEALAVAPASPLEIVRSANLLQVAVPEIERRARSLKREIADLRQLSREITDQRARLRDTARDLEQERTELEQLAARKRDLRADAIARSETAAEEAEKLAERAQDMRELMAELQAQREAREAAMRRRQQDAAPTPQTKPAPPSQSAERRTAPSEKPAPETQAPETQAPETQAPETQAPETQAQETQTAARTPPDASTGDTRSSDTATSGGNARLDRPADIRAFPDRQNSLTVPAAGRIVTRYGERMQRAGGRVSAQGIEIVTRPGAQVVAPYDGKVVYAGPFRGYGRILIIEHGGRYHSLLAGLERIDAVVGQWVLAGEPVGVMAGGGEADGQGTPSAGRTPKLYVELRRTGQPINPLPWLAQTGDKVRG
ncbi:MAG: peptidoglycan DD-metalloendopeptidase family protein [Rhodovibrio sp.]|nr:peptidoglycan DD-metalloendopeptidase family protein [Rhodovibrio sp.]